MKESLVSFLIRFFFGNENYTSIDFTPLQASYFNQEACVVKTIVPGKRGRVKYGGSFWLARCTQPISLFPKTLVTIKGRDNITLLVEPIYSFLPAASLEKRS